MFSIICSESSDVKQDKNSLLQNLENLSFGRYLTDNLSTLKNQIPSSIDQYGLYYTDIHLESKIKDKIFFFSKAIIYKNKAKTCAFFTNSLGQNNENEIFLGYCKNVLHKNNLESYKLVYKNNKLLKVFENEEIEIRKIKIEKIYTDQHLSDSEFSQLKKSTIFFIKLEEDLYEMMFLKFEPHNFKNCKNNQFFIIRVRDQIVEKLYKAPKCCINADKK